ncbi:DUF2062 domain-containing protein [Oceanicella sp. SM1341]|uniref:DUF2062 domain-containing protein n=1 Tax=Oceanicella sp. SM1341 TaxID=1548889 RepID=UPI000E4D51F5|nr:DUF2062 domain-containing protein [Oceanicella sp. SM1341]
MVFKRRDRLPLADRAREFFYPRKGWRRGIEYLGHRVKRLPDSPHRIAMGFAAGAFVSFSPMFGLHFLYAAAVAWLVRGNVIASLIGTAVGNPLTFPFIAITSLGIGRWLLGRGDEGSTFNQVTHAFGEAFGGIWETFQSWFGYGPSALDRLFLFFHDVFLPYFLGGTIAGLGCGAVIYVICRVLVGAYQRRRRGQMLARVKQKMEAAARKRSEQQGKSGLTPKIDPAE